MNGRLDQSFPVSAGILFGLGLGGCSDGDQDRDGVCRRPQAEGSRLRASSDQRKLCSDSPVPRHIIQTVRMAARRRPEQLISVTYNIT
jgi:hypothetical protein